MSNNEALNTIHYLGIVMDYLAIEVFGVQEFQEFTSSQFRKFNNWLNS